jgi:hypothetical protein
VLFSRAFFVWRQREHDKKENMTDGAKQNWRAAGALRIFRFFLVFRSSGYIPYLQLGNDTTYDTEKKNPTSHDVADTSAVSGRRVGKT